MKIICLQAENVKRLSAVEIRPDGNLVVISGKNGAGKTSVLDAIFWALAGRSHVQKMPIRKGAGSARIKLDLGEIKVQRTFTRSVKDDKTTTSLVVETVEGARFPSPQAMLDGLLGELSFDPLAFSRAPAKEQVDMLRALVPGFDFDALDEANALDYEDRTNVNREAKTLGPDADNKPKNVPEDREPADEAAFVDELEAAGKVAADIERRKGNRELALEQIESLGQTADGYRSEAEELQRLALDKVAEAEHFDGQAAEIKTKLEAADPLPEPPDTSEIRERLRAAQQHNGALRVVRHWEKVCGDRDRLLARAEELTVAIDQRNNDKAKAIADAKLPVEGMAFGAGDVTIGGIPFEQASDAEQLRASCAIAAALNPKLRLVRIRDGSLLDEDGLALLGKFADDNDMQVWVERVDSTGKVGFVIENGHIAGDEPETKPKGKDDATV